MKSATSSSAPSPLKEVTNADMDALFKELASSPDGLTSAEAKTRLEKYGPNALQDKNGYRHLDIGTKRHRKFLELIQKSLHSHRL
jgi:magnesium-transporting ATPase (P-type)